MNNLLTMKWICINCGFMARKSEKKKHEDSFDHKFKIKGQLVKPPESQLNIILPKQKCIFKSEVHASLFKFTGDVRKDYPKTYEVFDSIRGLLLLSKQGRI